MKNKFGYSLTIVICLIIIVALWFGRKEMHIMGQVFFVFILILIGGGIWLGGRNDK